MKDHFSKFSWAAPMKTKTAADTAEELAKVFLICGALTILQSDNGREFVAEVIVRHPVHDPSRGTSIKKLPRRKWQNFGQKCISLTVVPGTRDHKD